MPHPADSCSSFELDLLVGVVQVPLLWLEDQLGFHLAHLGIALNSPAMKEVVEEQPVLK